MLKNKQTKKKIAVGSNSVGVEVSKLKETVNEVNIPVVKHTWKNLDLKPVCHKPGIGKVGCTIYLWSAFPHVTQDIHVLGSTQHPGIEQDRTEHFTSVFYTYWLSMEVSEYTAMTVKYNYKSSRY